MHGRATVGECFFLLAVLKAVIDGTDWFVPDKSLPQGGSREFEDALVLDAALPSGKSVCIEVVVSKDSDLQSFVVWGPSQGP